MRRPLIAAPVFIVLQMMSVAQPPQTAGRATLEGVVVRAGTGEPLAGARVTLSLGGSGAAPAGGIGGIGASGSGVPAGAIIVATPASTTAAPVIPSVTTDRDGRFVFQNLDAGLYRLQVLRNGYARQDYGQRAPGGAATAIRLAAGQSMKGIVMALLPAGNVSGVVRDPDGQPQTGVPIQLLQATYNASGQRTFQSAGTARTNDRGEYRLYWITPGRYYVSAGTASGPNRSPSPSSPAVSPNEISGQSYTLTYYPGVLDARVAGVIDINPGAELSGIDFSVARQQLYRVRGRVIDSSTGQPPRAASVSLAYRTLTGGSGAFSSGEKYDAVTGEFELRNVPPGYYIVQAIAPDAAALGAATGPSSAEGETVLRIASLSTRPNARTPIDVSSGDVNGIVLSLSSGVSIPGRLSVDGLALSSIAGWDRIRVQLRPTVDSVFGPNLQPAAPTPQPPQADGSFAINGVSPGEFLFGPVTGLPTGVYVKEARFNQVDVLSQPMQFSGPVNGILDVVLSSKMGQLGGTAVDIQSRAAPGVQIVLVPDRQRNRTDLYKTTASDPNGNFLFRAVPPGDYRVFAWEALESYAYFDPDLLRRVEPQGIPIRISESAGSTVTVRMIPAGQ